MAKVSSIDIRVHLDEQDSADAIEWQASDAPEPETQQAKAMVLSLWDADARNALRIDLWTKDMTIDDMNDFFFQIFLSMADTYQNATRNKALMAEIKMFARDFAEKASQAARAQGGN